LYPKVGNNNTKTDTEAPPSEHNYTNHYNKFNLSQLDISYILTSNLKSVQRSHIKKVKCT